METVLEPSEIQTDEATSKEFRVFGPPGCGKTTWLARQIREAVRLHGSESVIVSSFTRAAATEIAGRDLPVDPSRIGTLHAHALRSLGPTEIAESKLDVWNEENPQLAMKEGRRPDPEDLEAETISKDNEGDVLMGRMNRLRGIMIPKDSWPVEVRAFSRRWKAWKDEYNLYDFTDLLEQALAYVEVAPGSPSIGFFDESQDFCPLELALVRKWGKSMDRIILVGDPNQNLYSFKGATPEAFLTPTLPPEQERVLSQSYRLPSVVHAFAETWLRQQKGGRQFEYKPAHKGGVVRRLDADALQPKNLVEDVAGVVDAGGSVMILAACSYTLIRTIALLRAEGIPFANRYRRKRGDWNPLRSRGVTAAERILAFLRPFEDLEWRDHDEAGFWTGADLKRWIPMIDSKSGFLVRGAKEAVKKLDNNVILGPNDLEKLFLTEDLEHLLLKEKQPLEWMCARTLESRKRALAFPIEVLRRRRSTKALIDEPAVTVGTIHSVKGGEADCSPPDEPVLTTRGYVNIKDVDPKRDRLVSYTHHTDKIRQGVVRNSSKRSLKGYPFSKSVRPYSGKLLTVTTEGSRTRITPGHKMLVKFNEAAKSKYVVYIMKRGGWWRIGQCRLIYNSNKGRNMFGPGNRSVKEDADAIWILKIVNSLGDAMFEEARISAKYGIPQTVFHGEPKNKARRNRLSSERLRELHDSLSETVEPRAQKLLSDMDLLEEYPIYTRGAREEGKQSPRKGLEHRFVIRAVNLLNDCMSIPTLDTGMKPVWLPIKVSKDVYSGWIYSLDVRPHHYYISGNAVVHNCVYIFPDLSRAGMLEWIGTADEKDAVVRQFYVGFTRAKEELVLLEPTGGLRVEF